MKATIKVTFAGGSEMTFEADEIEINHSRAVWFCRDIGKIAPSDIVSDPNINLKITATRFDDNAAKALAEATDKYFEISKCEDFGTDE